jgi:hypothetical protein
MKKQWLVVFLGLVITFQTMAQARPFIGYDKVPWGASVDDVRKIYELGENIALTTDESDGNLRYLLQRNVSSSINERKFYFNEGKLYRVWVMHKDASDSTVISLKNQLTTRYGNPIKYDENSSIDGYAQYYDHYSYKEFIPDIEVSLLRVGNNYDLRGCYTWKKFRDEYQASKLDL